MRAPCSHSGKKIIYSNENPETRLIINHQAGIPDFLLQARGRKLIQRAALDEL